MSQKLLPVHCFHQINLETTVPAFENSPQGFQNRVITQAFQISQGQAIPDAVGYRSP